MLMDEIRNDLSLPFDKVIGLESVRDLEEKLHFQKESNSIGINFKSFGDNLKYSMRSTRMKSSIYNDKSVIHIQDDDQLLTLQHLIDLRCMELKGTNSNSKIILNFGSFVIVLLNVLILVTFLVPMAEEKLNGIQIYLSFATEFSNYNAISFFLILSGVYIIFMIAAIIIGFTYKALGTAPVFYIIILFALYLVSTMLYTYTFLISGELFLLLLT